MNESPENEILSCWEKNAEPWVTAVRDGQIESRLAVTNRAILDAIYLTQPKTVLDVGCGEGWLVRALDELGVNCLGVDGVGALIEAARMAGGGRFETLSYEQVSDQRIHETFDLVVCNFSLLGDQSVSDLFKRVPSLLNEGGSLVVQTLHPNAVSGGEGYESGWRAGSWAGFDDQFCDPAPWYFRTMAGWRELFEGAGFQLTATVEPLNPGTQIPASVVFTAVFRGVDNH